MGSSDGVGWVLTPGRSARTKIDMWQSPMTGCPQELPECLHHRQLGRPPRREESAQDPHHYGEDEPGEEETRRHAERERDLAEARPVGRVGDDAVDRQRD